MNNRGEGRLARFTRIKHPIARDEDLLVEQVGDEIVVYDSRTNDAHCLTPLAAIVFEHSDGETTIAEMAVLAGDRLGEPVDEPRVIDALVQLQERDLLAVPPRVDGLSRRQMLRKGAVLAGAAASVPLITTILAPSANAAASQFCSNLCDCCEPGCVNQGATCNTGGNNCCFGLSCTCTAAGISDGKKHCKPGNAGAINCAGSDCGTPPDC